MRILVSILIVAGFAAGLSAQETEPEEVTQPAYLQPALLTSVGQAADVQILKALGMRAGVNMFYRPQANGDSLSDCSTLLLVAGGSSKGLGAAKIDPVKEIKRVKGLIKAAKKAETPILVYHIGGDARRGALSDPFNKLAAEAGEQLIVVAGGDEDGFFVKIAEKSKAEYISVEKQFDVIEVLKKQFGIE